jgi:hypothetical protein
VLPRALGLRGAPSPFAASNPCGSHCSLDLEASTPWPFPVRFFVRKILSQVSTLLQSFTTTSPLRCLYLFRACRVSPEVLSLSADTGSKEPLTFRRFPQRRLRCALRISHPLSALLPLLPRRFVSPCDALRVSPSRF